MSTTPQHETPLYVRYLQRLQESRVVRAVLGLVVILTIALLFPVGHGYDYEYEEGEIWIEEDLIAPEGFSIKRDPRIIEQEQEAAAQSTPRSFNRYVSIPAEVRVRAAGLVDALYDVGEQSVASLPRRRIDEAIRELSDSLAHQNRKDPAALRLSMRQWEFWLQHCEQLQPQERIRERTSVRQTVKSAIDNIYSRGFIDKEKSWFTLGEIAVRIDSTTEMRRPLGEFLDQVEVAIDLQQNLSSAFRSDTTTADLLLTLVYPIMQPDVVYDNVQTEFAIQDARNKVRRTDGIVKENERIVSRHEVITPVIKAKIDSYMQKKLESGGTGSVILQFVGKAGHAAAILFLPVIYITLFRKRIINNNSRLLLISIVVLLIAFLSNLTLTLPVSAPIQYLIFVPAASMLLTIIFDSRVAFYITVSISFVVGALRGGDYSIILASLLAGSLAIYTVRDIKNRTQIFRSLSFIFLGYAIAIVFGGLQKAVPEMGMLEELGYALANAVFSPVLTFGMLVFFEKVFRITTDLTLLELSDFNHPLLRDLSARAPGTFHHSIVMGTLAEAAATAIGANATLARVGAYYHDIGKMLEPDCFVENQIPNQNLHDTLEPRDSARRIIDHVIRGIDLAREHDLPDRVIEFIPAHHGTTLVSYFYEKEKAAGGETIEEAGFRYGGPRPATKETGIVMLADTIEAAARAMDEPTTDKIRELIDRIVAKRLKEGELQECDLTFRELNMVKESFLNTLTGIHHSRIKYPTEEDAKAAQKLADRTSKLLNMPSAADALTQRIKKLDSF